MNIEKMNRSELEVEILNNDDLFKMFDEEKLMNSGYSDEEYKEIITEWIIDGNEAI